MKSAIRGLCVLAASAGFFASSTAARASFYVSNLGTATASAGNTALKYTLTFNPNDFSTTGSSQLTSGNYVTLYDFSPALVPGTAVSVPANITSSIQPTGFTASNFPGSVPQDLASIDNITFTYTGGTLLASTSFDVTVTLPGSFSLGSQFGFYGGLATYQTTAVVGTTGSI